MNRMADKWQNESAHRLRQFVMRATLRGKNYSPDTSYEQLKRGHCGPHSLAIGEILQRWASMWAADMREAATTGIELDANAEWNRCIAEANAEIDRYTANNRITKAA